MTLTDTWTTRSGKTVTVSASLITSSEVYNDGDRMTIPCTPRIDVSVLVEGIGYQLGGVREIPAALRAKLPADSKDLTHMVGKYCMTSAQAGRIAALRAQLESQPVWQQHLAITAQRQAEAAEYDAHRARVDRMMSR